MTRPIVVDTDVATGQEISREMNDAEYTDWQARVAEYQASLV